MNEIIKKELEKCKTVLPYYDNETDKFFIPKLNNTNIQQKEIVLKQDYYYIIKLKYYIIHQPDNFTLDSNWNKGIHPNDEYMLGTPKKFLGKMIQWDACGYDKENNKTLNSVYYDFWLPAAGFDILEEMKP